MSNSDDNGNEIVIQRQRQQRQPNNYNNFFSSRGRRRGSENHHINIDSSSRGSFQDGISFILSLLSCVIAFVIGIILILIPYTMIHVFLSCDDDSYSNNENHMLVEVFPMVLMKNENETSKDEVSIIEITLTRLVGGLFVSLSLSSVIMLALSMNVSSSNKEMTQQQYHQQQHHHHNSSTSNYDSNKRYLIRSSLCIQFIMGVLMILVGLVDERGDGSDSNGSSSNDYCNEFKASYIFGLGTIFLILSCFGLMISFWPPSSSTTTTRRSTPQHSNDNNTRRRQIDTGTSEGAGDLSTPLLTNQDGNDNNDEEAGAIRNQGNNDNSDNRSEDTTTTTTAVSTTTTSRITGTRRLIKLAKPQMTYLYVGCVVLLIRLPFSLSIPHFVSTTLGALAQQQYTRARIEILLLFILGTIDALLDFWCVFLFGYAKERIVKGVRIDLYTSILKQDVGTFFDNVTSGDLSSRLNSDCGEMASDLTWFFRFSIESVVRIIGIATYMLIRSPILGCLSLCIVPVVAIINKIYGNWLSKNALQVQNALAKANSVAQETLSCIKTVLSFASEEYEIDKYTKEINIQYDLNVKQLYMTGIYYMVISTFLINTCVQAALLLIGTTLIQHDKLIPEILLAFMLYQGQLQNETMNLFQSYASLIKSSGAGDKVFALLDRKPPPPGTGNPRVISSSSTDSTSAIVDDISNRNGHNNHDEAANATSTTTTTGTENSQNYHAQSSVQLSDIDFYYQSRPTRPVLQKFNLNIPAGSTMALVGPSGCGKSTVISLLQRFYDPTRGRVLIDDIDLRSMDIKTHRRHIGTVTQDPILFSGTILSNIMYGYHQGNDYVDVSYDSSIPNIQRQLHHDAIKAAKLANAHDFITSFPFGYNTEVGERGAKLSGGQKQRIAIARAIFKNPSLLLLDEATSALDAESEQVVQEALDHLLNANKDMTTVVVAHRLRTVRHADCIAFIEEGRVAEFGTHEKLMLIPNGRYKSMVEKATNSGKLPDK